MLASITPLGERGRQQRWAVTVSALIAGGAAAGGAAGAALAAAGRLAAFAPAARLDLLLVLAATALVLDLHPFGLTLPSHRRQVDETWLRRYRGWVYGAGFGGQLGVGIWTAVVTPAVYVTLAAEALAPTVASGLVIGATFGLVRGATALSTARIDSVAALRSFHRRFDRGERTAAALAVVAQLVVVVSAAALAS